MAPAPKEVDVFSGPHSRMKELVRIYLDKLTVTDFTNYSDLRELLWSLTSTFREFKTHECIENECIMQKLQHRLDFLKVDNQAVCMVHSDNRLSEMQSLLEDGCLQTERYQSPSDMKKIGCKISEALGVFTKDFLPHMQEEEELFQPLLMQYFTYEELKRIRYDVIEKHTLHTKYCSDKDDKNDHTLAEKIDEVKEPHDDATPCKISALPVEVILQIFSYLSPKDLCRTAQVNTRWDQLSMDGGLWKSLSPVQWAQGDWHFQFDEDDVVDVPRPHEGSTYVTVDEDADFDESESSADSDDNNNNNYGGDTLDTGQSVMSIRREAKMLDGIANHLIPVVGHGVETIVLAQSKGLNNAVVYRLLANSPNLKRLDLSLTKVSDIAFKGFGKNGSGQRLTHLNLSGCTNITDATIKRLAVAINPQREFIQRTKEKSCSSCCRRGVIAVDGLQMDKNGRPKLHVDKYGIPDRDDYYQTVTGDRSCPCSTDARDNGEAVHNNVRNEMSCVAKRSCDLRTNVGWFADDFGCGEGCSSDCYSGTPSPTATTASLEDAVMLEFLSLAGCYKITDEGLRSLAAIGSLPNLVQLDLSGCLNVTSAGLNLLASTCHRLSHEEFFYCDNILEGPYADTASGCQNLQCSHLVCCRSGL